MLVDVAGLRVFFPYDYIYPEQYQYMVYIKRTLDDNGGHCLLEMPTGTGKTVCLLSITTAYQYAASVAVAAGVKPAVGKIIYCTRTVQEMDKAMEELRKVYNYRNQELAKQNIAKPRFLGVSLSSRRNMCIHDGVSQFEQKEQVDSLCRSMTTSWVREQKKQEEKVDDLCPYFEGFEATGADVNLDGVFDINDLKQTGVQKTWCPYFLARHLINLANVVIFNYQYLIDPKIASMVSKELESECIVCFDEAHNIDNVCLEAYSVKLNKRTLVTSSLNLRSLSKEIDTVERRDSARLQDEVRRLVQGLQSTGSSQGSSQSTAAPNARGGEDIGAIPNPMNQTAASNSVFPSNFALSHQVLREAVPGPIRKAKHFVAVMASILVFLKEKIEGKNFTSETPRAFLGMLRDQTQLADAAQILRFCSTRLQSLMRTLRLTELDKYTPLVMVADFVTLAASHETGSVILMEPYDDRAAHISDPILQLACLDAGIAMRPIFSKFRSVIITSGTLSPLEMYPKLLSFTPKLHATLTMTLSRQCIRPAIVTKGSDQMPLSTRFEVRSDDTVVRNYGRLLCEMAACVPDGMCCFFPSYQYMEDTICAWFDMGFLAQVQKHKLLFVETKDIVETSLALDSFKKACDSGRGAIFLSVARGKVAEGIDFDRHYGRCVIMFGIPYQYSKSRVLLARLKYLHETFGIDEKDFMTFDAMRQCAQCVGRVIRSKLDYGMMVFADCRYARADKRRKLPRWIQHHMSAESMDLSVERAVTMAKQFMRSMAQPHNRDNDIGTTLLTAAQAQALPCTVDTNAAEPMEY